MLLLSKGALAIGKDAPALSKETPVSILSRFVLDFVPFLRVSRLYRRRSNPEAGQIMKKRLMKPQFNWSGKSGALAFTLLSIFGTAIPSTSSAANVHLVPTNQVAPPSGARSLCQNYNWACTSSKRAVTSSAPESAIVKKVNLQINRSVREVSDQSQYQRVEHWALPTSLGGDCEDFALIKKQELQRYGVDPKRLLLATVLDINRNSHAVLVYRTTKGDFVLDNVTNDIRRWHDTGYIFLRMQDPTEPRRWVTGFKHS